MVPSPPPHLSERMMSATVATVVLLLLTQTHAAPLGTAYLRHLCAKQGPAASETWMNASRTCLTLHPKGAPIQVPDDSNNTKWGQLQEDFFGDLKFVDRNGTVYPLSTPPPTAPSDAQHPWKLLVVQATLQGGNVTSYKTILYVPYSTVMAAMSDTVFEGQLLNMRPRPVGPNATSWFKWTFSRNITIDDPTDKYGTFLHGSFINLFHAAVDASGRCRPALCADPDRKTDACRYYVQYFGNSTAMTLNWDTGMHGPGDTELVPMFPATHRQYMAGFSEMFQMLQPSYRFVPRNFSFSAHGTPLGIPLSFTGTLVKASKSTAKLC